MRLLSPRGGSEATPPCRPPCLPLSTPAGVRRLLGRSEFPSLSHGLAVPPSCTALLLATVPCPPPQTFKETVQGSQVCALRWALQRGRAQPGTCSPITGPSGIKILPSANGRRRFISGWSFLWVGISLWFLARRNTEHSA